jgi:hypothetical protein
MIMMGMFYFCADCNRKYKTSDKLIWHAKKVHDKDIDVLVISPREFDSGRNKQKLTEDERKQQKEERVRKKQKRIDQKNREKQERLDQLRAIQENTRKIEEQKRFIEVEKRCAQNQLLEREKRLKAELAQKERVLEQERFTLKQRNQQIKHALEKISQQPQKKVCESVDQCMICWDEKPDSAFVPCGHAMSCFACAEAIQSMNKPCPMCRGPIQSILKLYA